MGNFGMREILFIVFIVVLLFGAKKIPELARGMGRGVKEFKDGMRESTKDEPKIDNPTDKKL
jgi:sec-independent protein translocase protein TatA